MVARVVRRSLIFARSASARRTGRGEKGARERICERDDAREAASDADVTPSGKERRRTRLPSKQAGADVGHLGATTHLTLLVKYGLIGFMRVSLCQGSSQFSTGFVTFEEHLR